MSNSNTCKKHLLVSIMGLLFFLNVHAGDMPYHWTGMKFHQADGVFELEDTKTDAGPYLLTVEKLPIDCKQSYLFQVRIRTEPGAANQPGAFIRIFNQQGKALKNLRAQAGKTTDADGFRRYSVLVKATEWPSDSAFVKLMLQPASGKADGIGKAWFKELDFSPVKSSVQTNNFAEGVRWTGMKFTEKNGIMELADDRKDVGMYLITSSAIPIDRAKNYLFRVQIRKEANATNRPSAYIRVFDAAGKPLTNFHVSPTGKRGEDGFQTYSKLIQSKEWPKEAASVKLMLQPASGKAEATGKAAYRNLEFKQKETVATLEGTNCTGNCFFKLNRIQVADGSLKNSPFACGGNSPARIEIASRTSCRYRALQLVGTDIPQSAVGYLWNEEKQEFEKKGVPLQAVRKPGCVVYELNAFPPCFRLALEFPKIPKTLLLDEIRVYSCTYPQENWNANWIWFTKNRIDNIDLWLRGEYEFKEVPIRAILQCAADDVAQVFVNGNLIGQFSGRIEPPNYEIQKYLVKGKNVIAVKVHQFRYSAGFLGELDCRYADGHEEKFITDKNWLWCSQEPASDWTRADFNSSSWNKCLELAKPPQGEWGKVSYRLNTLTAEMDIQNAKNLPTSAKAGDTLNAILSFHTDNTIAATPLVITLRRGRILFQQWDAGVLPAGKKEFTLPIQLKLHQYLFPGEYILECKAAHCSITAEHKPFRLHLNISNDRHADLGSAVLQRIHGVPTLVVDGKPAAATFSAVSLSSMPFFLKHHRIFHAARWNLAHLYIKPDWAGDTPDFTMLDAYAAGMLEGNPDAKAVLKLVLRDSQTTFTAKHPSERAQFDNGSTRENCSLTSTLWRKRVSDYITAMIDHVAQSPYADKIIGCVVCEGEEGQWLHYWGAADPEKPGAFSDYSAPMVTYFRDYLKKKYHTETALRRAWSDPAVTFENATVPDHDSRAAHDCGVFRDPGKRAAVIDYAEALSMTVVEGMEHYGKLIKDKTKGRWLTGALYGHTMDVGMYMLLEQGGGLAQRQALMLPHVDIFMGPLLYHELFRDIGGVGSYDTPSPGSCLLHNKMWVNEDDLRTHLTFPAGYAFHVRSTAQMNQVLARQVGKNICGRAGHYLLNLGLEDNHNWYDDPETIQTLRELNAIAQEAVTQDCSSRSQIAVFADANGVKYTRLLRNKNPEDSLMRHSVFQREAIGRIGAAYDEYMQSELENPALPRYRFYIFLNPFHLTEKEKARIRELAADPTIRLLFLYAPGIISEKGLDLTFANELTKMDFSLDKTVRPSVIENRMAVESLKPGTCFGWKEYRFSPSPVPRSFDRLLAVFPADQTPAAVAKGNVAYSTLGALPPEILRQLAKEAGVAIRSCNNIAVYECASYMAVHSSTVEQECAVHAPEGYLLKELWPNNGKPVKVCRWHNTVPVTKIFQIIKPPIVGKSNTK